MQGLTKHTTPGAVIQDSWIGRVLECSSQWECRGWVITTFSNECLLPTNQETPRQKSTMSLQHGWVSQCSRSPHKTHTNLGSHFNWHLEHLGDRIDHTTEKKGAETGSQVIWLGRSNPHKEQQSETLWIESFTASPARPRTVQLCGGKGIHHYQGSLPLPRQSIITKAVRHYQGSTPLQRQTAITKAVLTILSLRIQN